MTPNPVKGSNSLPKDRTDDPNHPANLDKYKPDSLKNKDSTMSSGNDSPNNTTEPSKPQQPGVMDGDHTAKTLDQGANSAMNVTDFTDGIHEAAHQGESLGEKETGHGVSAFNKDGPVGSAFKGDGILGQIGNKIGGPFASTGAVGKQFEADGKIGGAAQGLAKKNESH